MASSGSHLDPPGNRRVIVQNLLQQRRQLSTPGGVSREARPGTYERVQELLQQRRRTADPGTSMVLTSLTTQHAGRA